MHIYVGVYVRVFTQSVLQEQGQIECSIFGGVTPPKVSNSECFFSSSGYLTKDK